MRRKVRNTQNDDMGNKIIKYATIGVVILTIIVIGLLVYSQNLTNEVKEGALSKENIANLVNRANENSTAKEGTEEASTKIGKSVEEVQNETKNQIETNISSQNNATTTNTNNTTNTSNVTNTSKSTNSTSSNKILTTSVEQPQKTETTEEPKSQELSFIKPVEGEIIKGYAKENLVFSNTLQEWTVHTGIDIKAEKTTVVKAAEEGTVKSIKNDPRYGLTVVVEHNNGFQTVYANLLTSEFVVEGEKIKKEQSIGTVGNTSAFESSDEVHLHFEILKDNLQVDPSIYLK